MPRKLLPILMALLIFNGCSWAPHYVRPTTPIPHHWPQEAHSEQLRHAPLVDWQTFFPDPQLQAFIQAALEHNRDMHIAIERVKEARALYGIVIADRLPTLTLNATENASHLPAELSSTGRAGVSRRYDVNVGALSFELDFWGRVISLTHAAQAAYLATEEAQRAFRLSLIADVADAYFKLKSAQEREALAHALVKNRTKMRFLVAKKREMGLLSQIDDLQAESAYEAARAELADTERQRVFAQNYLRALVVIDPATKTANHSRIHHPLIIHLPANIPSDILVQRPDILAAEQRLISANANIGAARAAFLPKINLTGAFGVASRALSALFDGGSGAWNYQPVLTLPILDTGRNINNLELAWARKNIAVAEYEKAIQQAFREVSDLLTARQKLTEQLAAQEAIEKAQRQRFHLMKERYHQGVANLLEALDAQRDFFNARLVTIQIRQSIFSTSAQLYKALGGDLTRDNNNN